MGCDESVIYWALHFFFHLLLLRWSESHTLLSVCPCVSPSLPPLPLWFSWLGPIKVKLDHKRNTRLCGSIPNKPVSQRFYTSSHELRF